MTIQKVGLITARLLNFSNSTPIYCKLYLIINILSRIKIWLKYSFISPYFMLKLFLYFSNCLCEHSEANQVWIALGCTNSKALPAPQPTPNTTIAGAGAWLDTPPNPSQKEPGAQRRSQKPAGCGTSCSIPEDAAGPYDPAQVQTPAQPKQAISKSREQVHGPVTAG